MKLINGTDWHEPVKKPQRAMYNSGGNPFIRSGAFGGVRKKKNGTIKNHGGIDIFAPIGTPVYACLDGEIIRARDKGGYGKNIIIKVTKKALKACKNNYQLEFTDPFNDGTGGEIKNGTVFNETNKYRYLLYAHLDTMLVNKGDKVNAGNQIGTAGKTGNAIGADVKNRHLHFEVLSSSSTGGYYELENRENPAFYVNFVKIDREKQEFNKD